MDNLMFVLGWGSPIGVGIFLLCIAGMIFIISKEIPKRPKTRSGSGWTQTA